MHPGPRNGQKLESHSSVIHAANFVVGLDTLGQGYKTILILPSTLPTKGKVFSLFSGAKRHTLGCKLHAK